MEQFVTVQREALETLFWMADRLGYVDSEPDADEHNGDTHLAAMRYIAKVLWPNDSKGEDWNI